MGKRKGWRGKGRGEGSPEISSRRSFPSFISLFEGAVRCKGPGSARPGTARLGSAKHGLPWLGHITSHANNLAPREYQERVAPDRGRGGGLEAAWRGGAATGKRHLVPVSRGHSRSSSGRQCITNTMQRSGHRAGNVVGSQLRKKVFFKKCRGNQVEFG